MVDTKHTEGMAALARARFTERSLATALRTGTTQYVVLGEELGDFALRERELKAQSRSFQVDWSGNWNEQLLAQGFSPRKKACLLGWDAAGMEQKHLSAVFCLRWPRLPPRAVP